MSSFMESLEELLRGFRTDVAVQMQPLPPKLVEPEPKKLVEPEPMSAPVRPQSWFAHFAEEQIMPLFRHTVEEMKRRGFAAQCTLEESDQVLVAELVIVPPGLPAGERPPRLSMIGVDGRRIVEVNYTGTFPHAGQEGVVGAEIGYDTAYPSQIEERILEFVGLATGT